MTPGLHHHLTKNFTFSFEMAEKKVRLIILDQDDEQACRKESLKKLRDFVQADESEAFRGRLRLLKQGDKISVLLKNDCIGILTEADFSKSLELLKAGISH